MSKRFFAVGLECLAPSLRSALCLLVGAVLLPSGFLQSQTPRFFYDKVPDGILNGEPVCGLWHPNLFAGCYAPAFLDWDKDGLKDLFFGSTDGRIYYYKNTGTAAHPCFTLVSYDFGGISVPQGYAAPFPCDLNADGKIDFLVGNGIAAGYGGTVQYFKGTGGTLEKPTFVLEEDTLAGIDLSDASVPFAVDIDGDGDLDLFIGEGYGRVFFRENTGTPQVPVWNSVNQLIPNSDLGWRTAVQVVNIQGDSKLEMIAAEAYGSLRLFNNISTKPDTAIWQITPGSLANIDACVSTGGCLVRPAFTDIDNDVDQDLFIRSSENKFYFYRNKGTVTVPVLELEEWNFAPLPGFYYALFFADTDLDKKLEMYVPATDGEIAVYENEGTPSEPNWVFQNANFLGLTTTYAKSLAFGDVNGDNRPDVLVGYFNNPEFNPRMILFLNTPSGFVQQQIPFLQTFPYGTRAIPELADLDNNKRMNLAVATASSQLLYFECTDSTGLNWKQLQGADSPLPSSAGDFSKVSFGDVDGDGDLDLAASGSYYENVGSPYAPQFLKRGWFNAGVFGVYPTLVELTSDCGLELFSGIDFYKYGGIQPDIKVPSTYLCTNKPPMQCTALPTGPGGVWLTDSMGIVYPDSAKVGYHGVIYGYSAPVGCHVRYDTVWLTIALAGDATIATINGAPIVGDTVFVCESAGVQTLVPVQPNGYFSGITQSPNKFDPKIKKAGKHLVTYQIYQNGCSDTDTLIIVVLPKLSPSAAASPANVCLGSASMLTATGGAAYDWGIHGTGQSISASPLQSTTYTVTVTDAAGCTATATVSVYVLSKPLASAAANPANVCPGKASTLIASGGGTYAWSNGMTGQSISVLPIETTTYTVTVTNTAGCTATATVVVNVSSPSASAAASPASICPGAASTMTATGGGTYVWSNGATGQNISVSPLQATTYTVTVTNAAGCTATATTVVTLLPKPSANAAANPVSVCPGNTSILTANGGATYNWGIHGTGQSIGVSPVQTSTYTVTVTDAMGCTATATVTVNVLSKPSANTSANPASVCPGKVSTLTANGGITYDWGIHGTGQSISVSPLQTTTYTVTVTNAANCTATATVVVNVLQKPSASVAAIPTSVCTGGASSLTATGGVTYAWNTGATGKDLGVTLLQTTTTYTVTVTNSAGCTDLASTTIVVHPFPDATIATINGTPIINGTILLWDTAGLQTLVPLHPGGTFSGIPGITLDGKFKPKKISTGTYAIIYTLTENGCVNSSTLTVVIQHVSPTTSPIEATTGIRLSISPNPFSNSLTIQFNLPASAKVQIVVVDMQGREIKTLLHETLLLAGDHAFSGNALDGLSAGEYVVNLSANGRVVRSQVVVKH